MRKEGEGREWQELIVRKDEVRDWKENVVRYWRRDRRGEGRDGLKRRGIRVRRENKECEDGDWKVEINRRRMAYFKSKKGKG